MALFDDAVFDSAVFDTGTVTVSLHGGTKQRSTGRRDLDKAEQDAEERRLAVIRKAQEQVKEAEAEVARAVKAKRPTTTILALRQTLVDAENELNRQAYELAAMETARAAADAALAQAIAVQRQLDDEAAQALLAYLLAT